MELDREAIMRIIPHRPPFLFVDRITAIEEARVVGTLQVTGDEWFFPGHFPGMPIMPGVLIVEAIVQTGACLALHQRGSAGRIPYFAAIDQVRFRRPVRPGDLLTLEAEIEWMKSRMGRLTGRALVDGAVAAAGAFTFVLGDASGQP